MTTTPDPTPTPETPMPDPEFHTPPTGPEACGHQRTVTEPQECNRPEHQDGHHGPECAAQVTHVCQVTVPEDDDIHECVCGERWDTQGHPVFPDVADAVARFRELSDAAGNPGAPGPTCPARYCLSGSHTHTCTRPYAHPDRGHHCACGDGWSANPDELPHPFRQAAVDDTECGMCGRDVADLLHAAPPGEPLAHALNHLAATLTDIQTRLDAIAARLPLRPTVERTPPGVWTLPGERGPEPVVPAWGATVDPARSTEATFHPADAPGIDGSPAWAYDEDGYCVSCGNGRWKHHMPGCELRDALDAVDREAPPPDEGAPTEGDG